MMKFVFLLLITLVRLLFSQDINVRIDTNRSFISYTGKHVLHSWTGTSKSISGQFILNVQDPLHSSFFIKVPVISFDSGNHYCPVKIVLIEAQVPLPF